MADPFLGEIRIFTGNFAPQNWALCNGQLLSISSSTALFSLIGTQFGGDGRSTFGLPDFRGRIPVGQGTGPGLSQYNVGQVGGEISHTLLLGEMALHTHAFNADGANADQTSPTGNMFGAGQNRFTKLFADGTNVATFAQAAVGVAGGGSAHENRQSFLSMNFIIALQGIFPQRP